MKDYDDIPDYRKIRRDLPEDILRDHTKNIPQHILREIEKNERERRKKKEEKEKDIRYYLPKHILQRVNNLHREYLRLADIIDYAYEYLEYKGIEKYEEKAENILEEIESILTEYDVGGDSKHFGAEESY